MIHFSFHDLKIFEHELRTNNPLIAESLLKDGGYFYIVFKGVPFAAKYVALFPGYRIVNVPVSFASGTPILTDFFPATIKAFKILNMDRVFGFWFKNKQREFGIIFELIGSLNNMYLINEDGKILYMARKVSDKRGLKPGRFYELPAKVTKNDVDDFVGTQFPECGYICREPEGPVLFSLNALYQNCVQYSPYTYALDRYFNLLYEFKNSNVLNLETLEKYVDILISELDPDYVFENDTYLSKNGIIVPVEKGERVSKVVGRYKAMLLRLHDQKKVDKVDNTQSSHFLEFTSPSGFKVLVGKSAKANRILTFNIAKSHDYFFHIRNYPGAHVVLFSEGKNPTEEDILYCAHLAVRFSRAGKGKFEVMYAPISAVYRKKGMKEGEVYLRSFKTLLVDK
ncbi:MAG: NFACT RNA binding domain-containing protein [Candidatus Hydrothermia bacterium]